MARVSAESILVHQKSRRTSDSRSIPAVAGGVNSLHLAVVPACSWKHCGGRAMLEPGGYRPCSG
jgi:hypothetical protein